MTYKLYAIFVSLALFVFVTGIETGQPTLKFFIQPRGMDQIQSIVNSQLATILDNVEIPDQHYSSLGIHLDLTNITLKNFNFSQETLQYNPPSGFQVRISNLVCTCYMNWSYTDGPAIHWSGWAEDDISNTEATLNLQLSSDNKGHGFIKVVEVAVNIGSLNIHMHGSGGQFFQTIVNLITPIVKKTAANAIASNMQTAIDAGAQKLFDMIPISQPLVDGVDMYYGLIQTSAVRGLAGTHYSNNHFSGSSSALELSQFETVSVGAYNSIDVSGWFSPDVSGEYTFQVNYKQRYQLDANGKSIGKLEMHNPGMCWPQWHTDTTETMTLNAGSWYPIRMRYQSGCGGGQFHLRVCGAGGANCQPLSALNVATEQVAEFPVTVWNGYIELASATEAYVPAKPSDAPFSHHTMPNKFPSDSMLGVYIDDFALNSIGYAFNEVNALHFFIQDSDIPPDVPFHLNTSAVQMFFPALYQMYPNDLMTLYLTPFALPSATISPDGIGAFLPIIMNISVIDAKAENASVPVITLNINATTNLVASVTDGRLCGKLTEFHLDIDLMWASVPVGNITQLTGLLNFFFKQLVIPKINAQLATGVAIPGLMGLHLENTKISYNTGYLAIETDFSYTPTSQNTKERPLRKLGNSSLWNKDMAGRVLIPVI